MSIAISLPSCLQKSTAKEMPIFKSLHAFNNLIAIYEKLSYSTVFKFCLQRYIKKTRFQNILAKSVKRFVLLKLSTDSIKQEAVKQAEVLGVSVKTIEKWIDKYVQSTEIVRVAQGLYNKRGAKIA